jgi:hypothetical protein
MASHSASQFYGLHLLKEPFLACFLAVALEAAIGKGVLTHEVLPVMTMLVMVNEQTN